MKNTSYRFFAVNLLAVGCVLAPATLSAGLLIGFHDFNRFAGTSEPTVVNGSFSGTINKTATSLDVGGSNATTYGDGSLITPAQTSAGDGTIRLSNGSATLTITNNSLDSYTLESLFFDAAYLNTSSLSHVISISSTYPSEEDATFMELGKVAGTPVPNAGTGNYKNFSAPGVAGLLLAAGDSIMFQFDSVSARIDNIALVGSLTPVSKTISPIPEPSGMLALGTLVSAGFLLRTRRVLPV